MTKKTSGKLLTRPMKTILREVKIAKEIGRDELKEKVMEFLKKGIEELESFVELDLKNDYSIDFITQEERYSDLIFYIEMCGFAEEVEYYRDRYERVTELFYKEEKEKLKAETDKERSKIDRDRIGPRSESLSEKRIIHFPISNMFRLGLGDYVMR